LAQKIQLKKSNTQSKVPVIGDLSLGELAVNTFDGKLFFKKDVSGTTSIETIVTTNAQITGSVNLAGALTSSLSLISNLSPTGDLFTVRVGGVDKVTVNSQGTLIIKPSVTLPTGTNGSLAVSGSNFFVYL
tara:strand:- start:791 stop:1183 length:393 start_codon:yes stop_codon:yes gene_type:complete